MPITLSAALLTLTLGSLNQKTSKNDKLTKITPKNTEIAYPRSDPVFRVFAYYFMCSSLPSDLTSECSEPC